MTKIDRPIISYAFLAQARRSASGDLFSGLMPIFKPIAKKHEGKAFDAKAFAKEISDMYGFKVSEWTAEDLAPRLEAAGILTKNSVSQGVHEYIYSHIAEEFNEVTEADIRDVVEAFLKFSSPLLTEHDIKINEEVLEDQFFQEVIGMDFMNILFKPEVAKKDAISAGLITLKKKEIDEDWDAESAQRSYVEILCAAFVLHAHKHNHAQFEILMKLTAGALLSEVVLNIQNPESNVDLRNLKVVLDTTFLMSFLNLSSEDSRVIGSGLAFCLFGAKIVLCLGHFDWSFTALYTMSPHGEMVRRTSI